MPAKVLRAECEVRLKTGRVVDVALVGRGDLVIAAIEVRHSHAVDDEKATVLMTPWIEVDADQVCATAGRLLEPIRDRFLPWLCAEHSPARRAIARAPREEALRRAAALRQLPFRPDAFPEFRAGAVVPCKNGHDAVIWEWPGKEPPWSRPPLVAARERSLDTLFSVADGGVRAVLPFRRRWVSTCAVCGVDLDATDSERP